MNNINNKNVYSKNFVKLALILVLILIMSLLFFLTWKNEYNMMLRNPYIMKGNIFLMIVYMILLYIFMNILDCNNISENRISNLIFSETLAVISTNILVYFVMIIPAAAIGLMPFTPIVILTIKDFITIILWSFFINYIFKQYFPPSPMILISNKKNIDKDIFKFSKQNDIYNIVDTISSDKKLSTIYNKCNKYDNIIIGDITSEYRNDIIKFCFNNSKNIYVIPKLSDILLKYSDDIFTIDAPVYLSTNFGLSLEKKITKRVFDVFISLFVLFIFLPIWIIVAILIKIEDGGPVFYLQKRITIDNKIFSIIKFRSMKIDADKYKVLPTIENDPRITNIGKLIRRFHIDEIPQFINVLFNDMSVVGPRPERIEHVELYSEKIQEFAYRSKVKAGITGLAQIYGKYNTTAIDKLKLDLIYIKKYSLLFDIELLFRTIKIFVIKDNTEGFDKESQKFFKKHARKKY